MDISTILPVDFEKDHMFYMQVDPNSILHYLPSLFYLKYSNGLGDWMYLMNLNQNRLQLRLGKTPISGFIMDGIKNVVHFYGLHMGGWLKLVYVGEDIFVVLKVKDYNMVKQPIPPNPMIGTICVNTNTLPDPNEVTSENVKDGYVPCLPTYSLGGNPLGISHDFVTCLHTCQAVSLQPDNMEVNNPKMIEAAFPINGVPMLNGVPLPAIE
ncbi:hypothetical protein PIB30_041489 [Stylosanthes scabra]|uniref:Uncharacterized protein n=1 Tax=Stylosanthes scabra TaxID=79078 RepID=A0ABU6TF74_9FABA|nr:hypothetical protein [Stylosanthes scabra]